MQKATFQTILFYTALALVFLAGIFFRIWDLESIPPGLHNDEAHNGLQALEISQRVNYKTFLSEEAHLYKILVSFFLQSYGTDIFFLRLFSVLLGILALFGFFQLCKELRFSNLVSLLGTFSLSFSFWHINFSRLALDAIATPFFLVWIFFFFFKGLHSTSKLGKKNITEKMNWHSFLFFAVSGLLWGIGICFDLSFLLLFFVFALLIFFLAIENKNFLKTFWRGIVVFLFSATIAALPILVETFQGFENFQAVSKTASILKNLDTDLSGSFSKSLSSNLSAFFFFGDTNQAHNHNGSSLIPMAWSLLLAFGFFLSTKEIVSTVGGKFKQTKSSRLFAPAVLSQAIFWTMLVPGISSFEDAPNALKLIGTIPAIFLFICFALEYLFKLKAELANSSRLKLKPLRWNFLRISLLGIVAVVVLSGFSQAYLYFNIWAHDPMTRETFKKEQFDLGKLIKQIPEKDENYLIVASEIAIDSSRTATSLETVIFSGQPKIGNYLFYHPFEALSSIPCEKTNTKQFVFQKSDDRLRDQFQKKCAGLNFEKIKTKDADFEFWVLK